MKCSSCGFENDPRVRFCGNCGSQIVEKAVTDDGASKFCPNCGRKNPTGARFCEECGSAILLPGDLNTAQPPAPRSSPAATVRRTGSFAWLWLLLGLGLVFSVVWYAYVYWLPGTTFANQTQVPLEAVSCTPQNAFYSEDFEDGQIQNWPVMRELPSIFTVVPAPDDLENSVLSIKKPASVEGQVQAGPQLSISSFANAVLTIGFYIDGSIPNDDLNWFSFNWLFSPNPVLVNGSEVYDSRYQLPVGYNYFEMRRLQQPLTNSSVDRSTTYPVPGKWHSLEIATFEAHTTVWLDGALVMEYEDPQPLPEGTFGLEAWLDDPAITLFFDDIAICELNTSPVP